MSAATLQPAPTPACWDDPANLEALRTLHAQVHGDALDRRSTVRAWRAFEEAQRSVVHAFAASRGWQSGKHFSLPRLATGLAGRSGADMRWSVSHDMQHGNLAWDHPDYFRESRKPYRPAGVVVHVYWRDAQYADELAARHGLIFETLPWSWYYPDECLAGVYRRAMS